MFENIKKKSGWFENTTCLNEHGKLVAKEHSEVATRNKNKETLRVPMCGAPINNRILCGHGKDDVINEDEIDDKQNKRNEMAVALDNAKTSKDIDEKDDDLEDADKDADAEDAEE